MVDPIGIKSVSAPERGPSPVGAAEPVAVARAVKNDDSRAPETPAATALTQAMAEAAPIDSDRVARIRRAVENGTFPLVPSTVADRLLALKMAWNPNE